MFKRFAFNYGKDKIRKLIVELAENPVVLKVNGKVNFRDRQTKQFFQKAQQLKTLIDAIEALI